jgi:diguanylate cyclase (GGDEF)-like protein
LERANFLASKYDGLISSLGSFIVLSATNPVRIAQTVQQRVCRPTDLVARYGGEEFSVLLSNTDLVGAIKVADSIQQAIHDLVIPHAKSDVKDIVTVSMGITSRVPTLDIKPDILITLADKALYNAKQNGRDRYCYEL